MSFQCALSTDGDTTKCEIFPCVSKDFCYFLVGNTSTMRALAAGRRVDWLTNSIHEESYQGKNLQEKSASCFGLGSDVSRIEEPYQKSEIFLKHALDIYGKCNC